MKKILILATMAALAMGLVGCSSMDVQELGRFTVISSKNVDISRLGEMQRSAERAVTKNLNAKGLLIKNKKLDEDHYALENALDSALEQIPGAVALIDAKVQYVHKKSMGKKQWGYYFEGTALIDSSTVGKNDTLSENDTICFISNEETGETTLISEEELNDLIAKMDK